MTKHAIVTGGSAGIGLEVALALAHKGFDLTLISSRQDRLVAAKELIESRSRSKVETAAVDFADLNAVSRFCDQHAQDWDLLVNNAGIKIVNNAGQSAQGFERHLAINHLAHFALTNGLMPTAQHQARIVTVSSIVARFAPHDVFANRSFTTSERYAASKLANLGFAIELDNRLRAAGREQRSIAAHPGFTRAEPYGSRATRFAEFWFAQHAQRGALPILEAAIASSPNPYYGPVIAELWGRPTVAKVNPIALDDSWRQSLWSESENLTRITFDF